MFKEKDSVTVIIAAAGSGTRMGGVSKPLLELCKKPLLIWSLDMFCECENVEKIVISAKSEDISQIKALIKGKNYTKEIIVTGGGKTRQESVLIAFKAANSLGKATKFVAVHDAARPLITKEDFTRALELAAKHGNAVCASRVRDTLKRSDNNCLIRESVDRENLWQIQTPQIFDTNMFRTALEKATADGISETDESGLVTHAGFIVRLSESSADNIKVTYPEDIFIAEAIMAKRRFSEENK